MLTLQTLTYKVPWDFLEYSMGMAASKLRSSSLKTSKNTSNPPNTSKPGSMTWLCKSNSSTWMNFCKLRMAKGSCKIFTCRTHRKLRLSSRP